MVTLKCPRKCEYCIVKNVKANECLQPLMIEDKYKEIRKYHSKINLTGGEPTECTFFNTIVTMAKLNFNEVHITTQNPKIFDLNYQFDSIVFSLHDLLIPLIPKGQKAAKKVYASILGHQYNERLVHALALLGYDGLTINEEQREGKDFGPVPIFPEYPTFSIVVNRIGKCMDETIILPDLRVITDFTLYL